MSALFDITVDSISSTAGLVAGALIVLAAVLPKILNSIKGDSIEGTVLQRISRHEKRMDRMDRVIHQQAVHLTRFEVVVLHLVALLVANGVSIPKHLQEEVDELTLHKGDVEDSTLKEDDK
jgi:hypothetical protein